MREGTAQSQATRIIEAGRLQLDMLAARVSYRSRVIPIGRRETQVLGLLIMADGDVVRREDLITEVWPVVPAGMMPEIRHHLSEIVRRLRRKIGTEIIESHPPERRPFEPLSGYSINRKEVDRYA